MNTFQKVHIHVYIVIDDTIILIFLILYKIQKKPCIDSRKRKEKFDFFVVMGYSEKVNSKIISKVYIKTWFKELKF